MEIDSAIKPEAASAGLAPTAVRPLMMTAKVLAKPTKAASKPVASVCTDKDRRISAALPPLAETISTGADRLFLGRQRRQRQGVNVGAELGGKQRIDRPLALDAALAGKAGGDDGNAEMALALGPGAGMTGMTR